MDLKVTPDQAMFDALTTLRRADAETQDSARQAGAVAAEKSWSESLHTAAGTTPETRILADGAIATTDSDVSLTLGAAYGPARLSGGATEAQWHAFEYGMDAKRIVAPNRRKTLTIAGTGRKMRVAMQVWVGKNLKPRNGKGYVIMPTVRRLGPQYVAAWIYAVIDVFRGTPFEIEKD